MHDMLVSPMLHLAFETIDDVGATLGKELQCTAGKNDPKTERHVGAILLEHAHDVARVAALNEISKVKARRTGTDDIEKHGDSSERHSAADAADKRPANKVPALGTTGSRFSCCSMRKVVHMAADTTGKLSRRSTSGIDGSDCICTHAESTTASTPFTSSFPDRSMSRLGSCAATARLSGISSAIASITSMPSASM